jgi:hypothetical protein
MHSTTLLLLISETETDQNLVCDRIAPPILLNFVGPKMVEVTRKYRQAFDSTFGNHIIVCHV